MNLNPNMVLRGREPLRESSLTRTVPFDYVVTVPVDNKPGQLTHSLVNISTVGPFVITGIGYSLLVDERQVPNKFFSPINGDDLKGLPSTPVPAVAPPPASTIVLSGASASATPGASTTPAGFRLFGAPGARLRLILNGNIVTAPKGQQFDLDDRGRLQVEKLSDKLTGRDTLVVTDIRNGRTSPAVLLLSVKNGRVDATPQFGPDAPHVGATRFEVVGTPGADVEVVVRAPGDKRKPRLQLPARIPTMDDAKLGLEAGMATVALTKRQKLTAADLVVLRDVATNLSTTFQVPANPLDVPLRTIPAFALRRGFRINPDVLRFLENEIPPPAQELEFAFEACGTLPQDVSFLYSIIDNGTGRALQSEPIHNIAGLGIADGDRPFRTFPKPIVLDPRSVLLFQVQEISGGPGTLYFVLQGYKVVGASRPRLPGSE